MNVLTKYNRAKLLNNDKCKKHYEVFIKTCNQKILNLIPLENNREEILNLALDKKLSYYDAEYLYLSRKLNIDLITYDRYLYEFIRLYTLRQPS